MICERYFSGIYSFKILKNKTTKHPYISKVIVTLEKDDEIPRRKRKGLKAPYVITVNSDATLLCAWSIIFWNFSRHGFLICPQRKDWSWQFIISTQWSQAKREESFWPQFYIIDDWPESYRQYWGCENKVWQLLHLEISQEAYTPDWKDSLISVSNHEEITGWIPPRKGSSNSIVTRILKKLIFWIKICASWTNRVIKKRNISQ